MPNDDEVLAVKGLVAGYGKKQVLNGVSLTVNKGEIVALIGNNGSGKSTLLKVVYGLLPIWDGQISFWGGQSVQMGPRQLLRSGVCYVPQGNRVFTELTVYENLVLASLVFDSQLRVRQAIEQILSIFPALTPALKRRASSLSGGERQMLSLANVLILSPRLVLLDEPSLGLAPALVSQELARIHRACHDIGSSVLIVEQKIREVLAIADRVYVLRAGMVSFTAPAEALRANDGSLAKSYL